MGITVCAAAVSIGLSAREAARAGNEASTPAPVYQLGEFRGRVAVFKYREKIPIEVLEVRLDSLPEYDQNELRKGVYVYSDAELQSRIEDYDS